MEEDNISRLKEYTKKYVKPWFLDFMVYRLFIFSSLKLGLLFLIDQMISY